MMQTLKMESFAFALTLSFPLIFFYRAWTHKTSKCGIILQSCPQSSSGLPFRFLLVEELPHSKFCHAAACLCVHIVEKVKLFVEKKNIYIYLKKVRERRKGVKAGAWRSQGSWRGQRRSGFLEPVESWVHRCSQSSTQTVNNHNDNDLSDNWQNKRAVSDFSFELELFHLEWHRSQEQ